MKELSELVLEKLNTLVITVNKESEVEYVSYSSEKILGYKPEQLKGNRWWNLTRNSEDEIFALKNFTKKLFLECKKGFVPKPYERILKTSSGKNKCILWNTAFGPNDCLVAIGYDITERKLEENRLNKIKNILLQQNAEILESIRYAQNIQLSILPQKNKIEKLFKGCFVLYKPKNIVSGDFYWYSEKEDFVIIAVIDCTGHGVPGAMLSVLANSILKKIVDDNNVTEPNEILTELDKEVIKELNKSNEFSSSDGMDISICKIYKNSKSFIFAGAFRPLILVRNNEIQYFRGNRNPIGFYGGASKEFEQVEIVAQNNDMLYLFSDGYIDQFGGEKNKKLNKKRFKELLITVNSMEVNEQESFLEYSFNNWKQSNEQTDDIVVVGIKL